MDWDSEYVRNVITLALAEDAGRSDVNLVAMVPGVARCAARIVASDEMVCAGLPLAGRVFRMVDPQVSIEMQGEDGEIVRPGQTAMPLAGKVDAILAGERTALNFLRHLSGVATRAKQFTERVAGTSVKICAAGEFTPGLRVLEEYAVEVGGGAGESHAHLHGVLLTSNQIALVGGVKAALDQAHAFASSRAKPRAMTAYEAVGSIPEDVETASLPIRIEVKSVSEVLEALSAGASFVVLKDMTPDETKHCVQFVRDLRSNAIVEISGGITLDNARTYAETGADYLAIGAVTYGTADARFRLLVERVE